MAAMPRLSCPRRASPGTLAPLILLLALAGLVAACGSQVAPTASTGVAPNSSDDVPTASASGRDDRSPGATTPASPGPTDSSGGSVATQDPLASPPPAGDPQDDEACLAVIPRAAVEAALNTTVGDVVAIGTDPAVNLTCTYAAGDGSLLVTTAAGDTATGFQSSLDPATSYGQNPVTIDGLGDQAFYAIAADRWPEQVVFVEGPGPRPAREPVAHDHRRGRVRRAGGHGGRVDPGGDPAGALAAVRGPESLERLSSQRLRDVSGRLGRIELQVELDRAIARGHRQRPRGGPPPGVVAEAFDDLAVAEGVDRRGMVRGRPDVEADEPRGIAGNDPEATLRVANGTWVRRRDRRPTDRGGHVRDEATRSTRRKRDGRGRRRGCGFVRRRLRAGHRRAARGHDHERDPHCRHLEPVSHRDACQ